MSKQTDDFQEYLTRTGKELDAAIAQLWVSVEEEKKYTQSLIKKAQKQEPAEPITPPPAPSKAEKIAQMSDAELMKAMSNPESQKKLFQGLN